MRLSPASTQESAGGHLPELAQGKSPGPGRRVRTLKARRVVFKAESKQRSLRRPCNLTKPWFSHPENSNRDPQAEYSNSWLVPEPNPGHLIEQPSLGPQVQMAAVHLWARRGLIITAPLPISPSHVRGIPGEGMLPVTPDASVSSRRKLRCLQVSCSARPHTPTASSIGWGVRSQQTGTTRCSSDCCVLGPAAFPLQSSGTRQDGPSGSCGSDLNDT